MTDELPACAVRGLGRWFAQEGGAACLRCPRVVTDQFSALAGPVMAEVTNPAV